MSSVHIVPSQWGQLWATSLVSYNNQLRGDKLREEMTARSRGPQSPRRGHAIRWHGPAVFDNL